MYYFLFWHYFHHKHWNHWNTTLLKFSRIENFSPCVFEYINKMDALRQKMGLIWRSEIKLETQKEPNQTLTRMFCVCFGILWCFLVLPTFWFVRKQAKLNTGNSMEFFRGPEKRPQQTSQIPTNWQPAQRHAKWP